MSLVLKENKRRTDEQADRSAQIGAANSLNIITLIGTVGGLIGILFLYLNFRQSVKALEIDQRPWLIVTDLSYDEIPQPGKPLLVMVKLVNTGKTPAFESVIEVSTSLIPKDREPEANTSAAGPIRFGMLAPSGIYSPLFFVFRDPMTGANAPIPADKFEDLQSGTLVNFIYGKITYRDAFKSDHWTKFCFRALFGTGHFVTCKSAQENDADH
jgi:hypothetical protein